MRLLYSTLFAAALVLGGVLLFTLPDVLQADETTDRTLWICPSVEDILAEEIPEVFEVRPGTLVKIDGNFRWMSVHLRNQASLGSDVFEYWGVTCQYQNLDKSGSVKNTFWRVATVRHLGTKFEPEVGDGTLWSERKSITWAPSCRVSRNDCGFYDMLSDWPG